MSTYVKWIRNSIPGDGTTHAILADGTELRQGEPVKLSAEQRHELLQQWHGGAAACRFRTDDVTERADATRG